MTSADLLAKGELRIRKARAYAASDTAMVGVASMVLPLPLVAAPTMPGIMATDGASVFWNPNQLHQYPNDDDLTFILLHEALHITLGHHLRRGDRDPEQFNIACDYVINLMLVKAGFTLPEGGYCDYKYDGMSADKVYYLLMKDREEERKRREEEEANEPDEPREEEGDGDDSNGGEPGGNHDGGGQGESDPDGESGPDGGDPGEGGDEEGDEGPGPEGGDEEGDEKDDGDGSGDGGDDDASDGTGDEQGGGEGGGDMGDDEGPGGEGEGGQQGIGGGAGFGEIWDAPEGTDLAEAEREIQERLADAATLEKAAGVGAGGIAGQTLETNHKNTSPWEWIAAFLKDALTPAKSWQRVNRRHVHRGLHLPGRTRGGGPIHFCIDVSGSVGQTELDIFLAENRAAAEEAGATHLRISYVDWDIQRNEDGEVWTDISLQGGDEIVFDYTGGGGTSFDAIFHELAEHPEEEVQCLIYLTDGYGSVSAPEPPFPVVWATTGVTPSGHSWGHVVDLSEALSHAWAASSRL